MKIFPSKGFPLSTLFYMKNKINIRPDYQRNFVWGKDRKQLYIDTIIRGWYSQEVLFAIPYDDKMYDHEVLDGQQRITTIFQFLKDELKTAKDMSISIDGKTYDIGNKYYNELPQEIKERVNSYPLNVVLFDGDREDYEEMFKRSQNGMVLNKAELRHAIFGYIQGTVEKLIEHPFFIEVCEIEVGSNNSRLQYNEVIEQMLVLELFGMSNIKDANIRQMYDAYNEIGIPEVNINRLNRIFDYMYKAFTDPVKYKRTYFKKTVLHGLYLVLKEYIDQDPDMKNTEKFGTWFINFENNRKIEGNNNEMYQAYNNMTSGTGSKEFLIGRKEILMKSWREWLLNGDSLPGMFKNYGVENTEDKVANG